MLEWPGDEVVIQSLSTNLRLYNNEVKTVQMLGSKEELKWIHDERGLKVKMPSKKPCGYAFTLKILR